MSQHPSFLELDRLAASGVRIEDHPHLGSCPQCQQHLARLAQPVGMPAWVGELGASRPRASWWSGWGLRSLVAVGAMAILAVVVLPQVIGPDPGPAFQVKGGPVVKVHLKRGEQVLTWSEGESLRPGDLLRLELAAAGFSDYAVLTRQEERWTVISHGRLNTPSLLLPDAWRVDDSGEEEWLRVVFSTRALDEAVLVKTAREQLRTQDRHTVSLVLRKERTR